MSAQPHREKRPVGTPIRALGFPRCYRTAPGRYAACFVCVHGINGTLSCYYPLPGAAAPPAERPDTDP